LAQGLYDVAQSSMDELGGFEPTDTTGFIAIESIRIKQYALALIEVNVSIEYDII
jgi:argininosuccinate synthase